MKLNRPKQYKCACIQMQIQIQNITNTISNRPKQYKCARIQIQNNSNTNRPKQYKNNA